MILSLTVFTQVVVAGAPRMVLQMLALAQTESELGLVAIGDKEPQNTRCGSSRIDWRLGTELMPQGTSALFYNNPYGYLVRNHEEKTLSFYN